MFKSILSAFLVSHWIFLTHCFVPTLPSHNSLTRLSALGDYEISLSKPLGIILEESEAGQGGVQVESLAEGGAADISGSIVRGDVLKKIGEVDVSSSDFDSIMELLVSAPSDLDLTFGDGLGTMDIAPNLAKNTDTNDLFLVDEVVRKAVREVRKDDTSKAKLGDLLRVEIVIGAGARDDRCMVRFFAIFSRDTVSTFSCSVQATGIKRENGVEIVQLSCAKDEGWGQTFDLINES